MGHHPNADVSFEPASAADLEALVRIRIAAMRPSLERVGRFDPQRARERFASGFEPARTRHILWRGEAVGFVVVKPAREAWLLEHLYLLPHAQNHGVGAVVLGRVLAEADAARQPLWVGALRGSDANRFYTRHGFELVERAELDNYYVRVPRNQAAKPR